MKRAAGLSDPALMGESGPRPGSPVRLSVSSLYSPRHTPDQIVDPYNIALGAMTLGVLTGVTAFRIATLRPGAVHIHKLHSAGTTHESQRLAKSYVDCVFPRIPAIQVGCPGPIKAIARSATPHSDLRRSENRIDGGGAHGIRRTGVIHYLLQLLGVREAPVVYPPVLWEPAAANALSSELFAPYAFCHIRPVTRSETVPSPLFRYTICVETYWASCP